jgi:hypothetical protein
VKSFLSMLPNTSYTGVIGLFQRWYAIETSVLSLSFINSSFCSPWLLVVWKDSYAGDA